MPTQRKSDEIDLLQKKLRSAHATIIADYRGLSVQDIGRVRAQLRDAGAEFRVAKNTLVKIAAERAGVVGLDSLLEGPTAIAFAGVDISSTARILGEFARTSRILTIRGGLVGSTTLSADQVGGLADLSPLPVLQAQLVGSISGLLSGFVGVLDGVLAEFARTLDARASQMAEPEAA